VKLLVEDILDAKGSSRTPNISSTSCDFELRSPGPQNSLFQVLAPWTTYVNPLDSKGNYSATSNTTKLVHWPLMGGLLHLVQRERAWAGCGPNQSLLAVPNVTAHPSTASEPITVFLYDGPLLCGFNVAIKGLIGIKIG